jgi:muramoyltetrapeptide carboxypeptidase
VASSRVARVIDHKLEKTILSKTWAPLREGDIVDLVAPGFACTPEELDGAVRFLLDWGLEPRLPAHIFGRDTLSAHDDDTRVRYLIDALEAPDSKAVWCVRGGYGSIRLVPELLKAKRPKGPAKLFIGLSDITTLHLFLNQRWNWATVHGPLLDRLGKGAAPAKFVRELRNFVFGSASEIDFMKLKPLNDLARSRQTICGTVSGGNLITLQSTLSTALHWQTQDKILFFEDIGERGYRVDRVLEHFRQAGLFTHAKAIVFGDFTGGNESDGSNRVAAVLKRFAENLDIPVLKGLQSGHSVIQRPLPLGAPAKLKLGDTPVLNCNSGVTLIDLDSIKGRGRQ